MTVSLVIGSSRHAGFTEATVTRSLETIAGTFSVSLSERDPGETRARVVRPGDRCRLDLDDEAVLDGYIDAVAIDYSPTSHTISVRGRDATGDLVDCSAATEPGEWHEESLENIVASLCQPFGINVSRETNTGAPFRRFRIEEGESVFEAIDRACRFRAVLPLSDGRGGLVLGSPAQRRAATRLLRGVNILEASGTASWLARHSHYLLLGQQAGNNDLSAEEVAHVQATARDFGVNRYRPLTIVGEQSQDADEAKVRIDYEANVRAARARTASVSVVGWREEGEQGNEGALWAPGALVLVSDDWLGINQDMLVSRVTQSFSGGGMVSALDLVPRDAFAQRAEPETSDDDDGIGADWW